MISDEDRQELERYRKLRRQVRDALIDYKISLRYTNYRSLWHRIRCWLGGPNSRMFDRKLREAEARALEVVNRTWEHRRETRAQIFEQWRPERELSALMRLLGVFPLD